MQIQKKSKRKIPIAAAIILCLVIVGALGFFLFKHLNEQRLNEERQKANTSDTVNDQKKADLPSSKDDNEVDVTKNTANIPTKKDASVKIDSLRQENGTVTYKASLEGVSGNGKCSAQYATDGAKPINRTTEAADGGCGPVNIPEMEFSQLGTWTLTVRYYENDSQVFTTRTLEVR